MLLISFLLLLIPSVYPQTIKQLNEITVDEELPIGSVVTFLSDKIPNLDQSLEYDLVTPVSSEFDLFSIDHTRHSLNVKKRLDFEQLCTSSNASHCIISISIAVSNQDTIYVYILPIHLKNINDNPLRFPVNRTVIEIDENDARWPTKSYSLPRAIDADGDLITYSLYLQSWKKPNGLFELDQTNFSLKPLRAFDREEQSLYLLRLVAHSEHEKEVSLDIIVIIKDINDNAPKCDPSQTIFYINNTNSVSKFFLNVTDPDGGDNGRLVYEFHNTPAGFHLDRTSGEIQFDYTQWTRREQGKLVINVSDHGKPIPLSSQCVIEVKYMFLYEINFVSNVSQNDWIQVNNLRTPIGQLVVIDKQNENLCQNCLLQMHSTFEDLVYLNDQTMDLYLNLNSIVLIRILSNSMIKNENLSLDVHFHVSDRTNPSIISNQNYSWTLYFDKDRLLTNSNMLFVQIHEDISLDERFPIHNRFHTCFDDPSKQISVNDPTETFDIDSNFNLIIKKYLRVSKQPNYEITLYKIDSNQTDQINPCSIELRVHIYNPYSVSNVYPYFSQSFYVLTSTNLSQFTLPILPPSMKYISSKSHEISIDESNGSITIISPSLFSSYYYDFHVQAINSQTPSLSCVISIRILFGINQQSPRLLENLTKQSLDNVSSDFLYQIKAYDPDFSSDDQIERFPPSVEYEIDSTDSLEIERYTGRIFRKKLDQLFFNFTVIVTDFGQPKRLTTRERFVFYVKSNNSMLRQEVSMVVSTTFILISTGIVLMIILLIILILLLNCCHRRSKTKKSLTNISPTTPDSRLIDNEYITTTTSLPRVINREQRVYPTIANNSQRNLLEQIHIPPPPLYTAEKVYIKPDYQQTLSINDINRYLERFEKIYNNSTENHSQEPVGSVV